jgi:hypothetical protein
VSALKEPKLKEKYASARRVFIVGGIDAPILPPLGRTGPPVLLIFSAFH